MALLGLTVSLVTVSRQTVCELLTNKVVAILWSVTWQHMAAWLAKCMTYPHHLNLYKSISL